MISVKRQKQRANLLRRKNRRKAFREQDRNAILEMHPLPTLPEIKSALCGATASYRDILRLAFLMDNVAIHHAPAYVAAKDYTGRTKGVRAFLQTDGYLASRYDTLMRFARLGKFLRLTSAFGDWDMSQATLDECPVDFDDFIYDELREEFRQYEGMNFKQIYSAAEDRYFKNLRKEAQAAIDRENLFRQTKKKAIPQTKGG